MSKIQELSKLELNRPQKPIVSAAAFLFLVLCILLELVARAPLVQKRLPYQAYGLNHAQLETQLAMLDRFVEKNGAPDCFVFGNSQSFREINADAFERAYERTSGKDVLCYNFSVTGSQIVTTAAFNRMLTKKYHPRLIVIGTSFLDFTEGRELQQDERFEQSDWLKYHAGKISVSGWLMENSYFWRILAYLSYAAPYGMNFDAVNHEDIQWDNELAPNGNALTTEFIDPYQPEHEGFFKRMQKEFGEFGTSTRNLAALDNVILFDQSQGATVVLAEMMYHPALLDLKDANGIPRADRTRILGMIRNVNNSIDALAKIHNITYMHFDPTVSIPKNGWFDLYHLNNNGAEVYSAWLGEQVALWVIGLPPR